MLFTADAEMIDDIDFVKGNEESILNSEARPSQKPSILNTDSGTGQSAGPTITIKERKKAKGNAFKYIFCDLVLYVVGISLM